MTLLLKVLRSFQCVSDKDQESHYSLSACKVWWLWAWNVQWQNWISTLLGRWKKLHATTSSMLKISSLLLFRYIITSQLCSARSVSQKCESEAWIVGRQANMQVIIIIIMMVYNWRCNTEALPTQHGYCAGVSCRSATGNCELKTCPRSLRGGKSGIGVPTFPPHLSSLSFAIYIAPLQGI